MFRCVMLLLVYPATFDTYSVDQEGDYVHGHFDFWFFGIPPGGLNRGFRSGCWCWWWNDDWLRDSGRCLFMAFDAVKDILSGFRKFFLYVYNKIRKSFLCGEQQQSSNVPFTASESLTFLNSSVISEIESKIFLNIMQVN